MRQTITKTFKLQFSYRHIQSYLFSNISNSTNICLRTNRKSDWRTQHIWVPISTFCL